MNIKPNEANKIMILLSLFLILLNESNNIVYAMITPNKQAGKILHTKQKKKQKQRNEKLKKIKEGLSENINLKSNDSGLSFINNSNKKAIIKLGNGIKGKGFITFENNDNNENGSFKLKNTYIEANNINIESNVTLLLTINIEGLLGGLKVYSDGSNLTISGDKQLIIELQKIEDTDKPQDVIL